MLSLVVGLRESSDMEDGIESYALMLRLAENQPTGAQLRTY